MPIVLGNPIVSATLTTLPISTTVPIASTILPVVGPTIVSPFPNPTTTSYVKSLLGPLKTLNVPIISPTPLVIPSYENLDNNADVRKSMINYYLDKSIRWLESDLSHLLDYLTVSGNSVSVHGKPVKQRDSESSKKVKINYVRKYLINEPAIQAILERFIIKYKIRWVNLYRYRHQVKDYLARKLENRFHKTI
jgi:hypothetical protein